MTDLERADAYADSMQREPDDEPAPLPIIPLAYARPIVEIDREYAERIELDAEQKNRIECATGLCATCGDRIARDGTCAHVLALLSADRCPHCGCAAAQGQITCGSVGCRDHDSKTANDAALIGGGS